ncbi:protein containing DUF1064 [gut metagenome]|uniref:Protein containing DUF1064 n=1 Tax=gut metagenome TaxID=749906 RepID=J9F770_9ZZZZ
MTRDEYVAMLAKSREKTKKPNKYKALRSGGYASRKEHRRASALQMMQRAGLISSLREQVRYELIPVQRDKDGKIIEKACAYIADFVYYDEHGNLIVEDTKGVRTDVYKIKRKLMLQVHGIIIHEV